MWRSIWFPAVLLLMASLWVYTRLVPWADLDPPHAHTGYLVPLGGGNYHAEAIIEAGGTLRVFILTADPTRPAIAEADTLTAYVTANDGQGAHPVTLTPMPQSGDPAGTTSQFVGELPPDLPQVGVDISIPLLRIGGERFRVAFVSPMPHTPGMPAKVLGDEERELFLTPGGKYTEEDIEANGRSTPSKAFVGFRAEHDHNPKPGDRICPVTRTKANPRCGWTIGGERYWFCCPPCIDEFVRLAKEQPDEIELPGAYHVP